MKVEKKEHYTEIIGEDDNGEFNIQIQNDCSQIRIETSFTDCYIDTNFNDLIIIRNTINSIIQNKLTQ